MIHFTTIVCLALANAPSFTMGKEDHGNKPILVSLYYESYCPDCIQFIGQELGPAWEKFGNNITLDLVPFGNAKQWYEDGHFKFDCQHGPKECVANTLHACAIHVVCGEGGTKKCDQEEVTRALTYIHCLEQAEDQKKANDQCAKSVELKPVQIAKCAGNRQGEHLLSMYGNRTKAFRPRVEYVPTVALDGKHSTEAENDLVGTICKVRPPLCAGLRKTDTNNVVHE